VVARDPRPSGLGSAELTAPEGWLPAERAHRQRGLPGRASGQTGAHRGPGIEEVTGVFDAAPDIAAVTQHINSRTVAVRLDGHSDYGMVLEASWDQRGPQIRKRISVIVLGDARNNYHASREWVLKSIRQRARHLYWLNPEPAYTWDTGDSIASEYAKHCDEMVECRNLRQLKEFVEKLD
jgi:uncharacterized protein